jgi:hypothetical protein
MTHYVKAPMTREATHGQAGMSAASQAPSSRPVMERPHACQPTTGHWQMPSYGSPPLESGAAPRF